MAVFIFFSGWTYVEGDAFVLVLFANFAKLARDREAMSCQRTTLGHGPLLETLFRSRAKATAASLHYKAISAHVLCLKEDEFVLMKYKTAAVTTEEVNSAPRIWNHLESRVALEFLQKWRVDLAKIPAHSGRATFRTHEKWPNG